MIDAIKYAEQICYSSKEVLHFTYEMAKKYADKPGIYVEAGVAAGAQIIAMAAGAPNKTIYAFDSFEGIPLPSNKDDQMPGIRMLSEWEQRALPYPGEQKLITSGATVVPLDNFYDHINNSGVNSKHIKTIEGWFENILPSFRIEPISILRLDSDLYNSTYVCLKYLYPKVIKGGLVIIDDWALPGCKQAVQEYLIDSGIGSLAIDFIKDENSRVAYWTK